MSEPTKSPDAAKPTEPAPTTPSEAQGGSSAPAEESADGTFFISGAGETPNGSGGTAEGGSGS
jgi:hypothetical protein